MPINYYTLQNMVMNTALMASYQQIRTTRVVKKGRDDQNWPFHIWSVYRGVPGCPGVYPTPGGVVKITCITLDMGLRLLHTGVRVLSDNHLFIVIILCKFEGSLPKDCMKNAPIH